MGTTSGFVARCSQDGQTSAVGYYRLSDGGQLPSLATLGTTLDGQSTVTVLSEHGKELEAGLPKRVASGICAR